MLQPQTPDGGPIYAETDFSHTIREPWNMASAAIFVGLAAFYAWRLYGHYRKHPLLSTAIPILLLGGVGGTLYHGLRSERLFLLMDFVPILVLLLLCAVYCWLQVLPKAWWLLVVLPPFAMAQALVWELHELLDWPRQVAFNLFYLTVAISTLVPILWLQIKTNYKFGRRFIFALVCFLCALLFRYLDGFRPPLLPMGTHFLWHTFGAVATFFIMDYMLRYSLYKNSLSPDHALIAERKKDLRKRRIVLRWRRRKTATS